MLFRLLIQAPSVDHISRFIKPVAKAIGYMLFMVLEFGDFSNESVKIRGSKNLVISSISLHNSLTNFSDVNQVSNQPLVF